ncbi:hypothetical protein H0H87_010644 [Tephrocybe sp. NHM501043]|nr:hypothetical protein H0H87_010644 [Tephrocybe sp. NHM501043]
MYACASPSRWSLCTDDSAPDFAYPNHPFASSTHDVHDPFAKGRVQVVRPDFPSPKQRSHRSPAPPPNAPLPTPPPHPHGRNQKVLRIRVAPATAFSASAPGDDWTLALPAGVAVPRSPTSPSHSTRRTKARSFLSTTSASSQCPSAWHPSPPPSPLSSPSSLPSLPFPAPPTHIPPSTSTLPPPRPPRSRSRPTSNAHAITYHPPRTADSTASTESTDSTATITLSTSTRRHRAHAHARALAALNGEPVTPLSPVGSVFARAHDQVRAWVDDGASMWSGDDEEESEESEDSAPYYTARSSFATARSATSTPTPTPSVSREREQEGRARVVSRNFGSAWGCRVSVRVRADSGVRPVES